MTKVVLLVEHGGVFQLAVCPVNIFMVSKFVLHTTKHSDWELKKTHIVIRGCYLAVVLKIDNNGFVVESSESFRKLIDQLSIMEEVFVASPTWNV